MKNFPNKIVHRDDIVGTLKSQFDASTIGRAIDRLLDDGTIYTAHSNDTFILEWVKFDSENFIKILKYSRTYICLNSFIFETIFSSFI